VLIWLCIVSDRSTVADASSRAIDPMTFDLVNVNQGSLFNSNNGIVTVSTSGYYYIYISAGAAQRQVSLPASDESIACRKQQVSKKIYTRRS